MPTLLAQLFGIIRMQRRQPLRAVIALAEAGAGAGAAGAGAAAEMQRLIRAEDTLSSAHRTDYVWNLKNCTRQRGQPCWGVCLPRAALAPCCRRHGDRADENAQKNRHRSRADAAGMSRRALPGSNTTINRSPDHPWTLSCRSQRLQPATTASDKRSIGLRTDF